MDGPDPGETGSWLQRRGTDLAVWVLVILAIIGFAAGAAWLLTDERLSFRVVTPPAAPRGKDPPVAVPTDPRENAPPPATIAGNSAPTWERVPSPAFPEQALAAGVTDGEVRLTCKAEVSGRLSECRILSETPAGYDFGANAVQAAREARIRPRQVEGVAVRSTTIFTVRYRMAP